MNRQTALEYVRLNILPIPIITIIVSLTLIFIAHASLAAEKERDILYWHDPMVPDVRFDAPGPSPFMDMDLMPVYADEASGGDTAMPEGTIRIDPAYIQTIGVQTVAVSHRQMGRNIRGFGIVSADTRREYRLDMRRDGWIINLETDAVGDAVDAGDLLFTYYSRDLMVDQSDYLRALRERSGQGGENPRQRLRLSGMDDAAIELLDRQGDMLSETPFHAPESGTVTELNVRPGAYVPEGGTVLVIQDFSHVWVEAEMPMRDLVLIQEGDPAQVVLSDTGIVREAVVDFIYPTAEAFTRTGRVRLVLDNPEGMFRPGAYAEVTIQAEARKRLVVPQEAVIPDSGGAYVIRAFENGHFAPQAVETGITADGDTEIIAGLAPGDLIVASGQFLIDAESQLRGVMRNMGPKDMQEGYDHAH